MLDATSRRVPHGDRIGSRPDRPAKKVDEQATEIAVSLIPVSAADAAASYAPCVMAHDEHCISQRPPSSGQEEWRQLRREHREGMRLEDLNMLSHSYERVWVSRAILTKSLHAVAVLRGGRTERRA
jgi:hypothetical protein